MPSFLNSADGGGLWSFAGSLWLFAGGLWSFVVASGRLWSFVAVSTPKQHLMLNS